MARDVDVFIVHDKPANGYRFSEILEKDYGFSWEQFEHASSVPSALDMLYGHINAGVVIAHKDIPQIQWFAEKLRKTDLGESVRFILESGEFLVNRIHTTAIELGADAGWDPTAIGIGEGKMPLWVVSQIRLGYLRPYEQELKIRDPRQALILTEAEAQIRYKALGVPWMSSKERER